MVLALVLVAAVLPASRAGAEPTSIDQNPLFDVLIEKDVRIPVSRAYTLGADLFFPAHEGVRAKGKLPALLYRTPTKRHASSREYARFADLAQEYARRGYVFVIQTESGRHDSEGRDFQYRFSAQDGHDTVEWIAAQPWSNGRVGTLGQSRRGQTQNALATLNPPHLAAMIVGVAGRDYHESGIRENGVFHQRYVGAYLLPADNSDAPTSRDPVKQKVLEEHSRYLAEYLWRMPLRPGLSPMKFFPDVEEWFFSALTTGEFPGPGEFWNDRGFNVPKYLDEHADVATLYIGSWYDTYAHAQSTLFTEVSRAKTKTPKRMIFHPLGHLDRLPRTWLGDVDFGQGVIWDIESFKRRWFDRFLKGEINGAELGAPVRIFVMGGGDGRKNAEGRMNHGGQWRDEQEWPLARARPTQFYFHGDGVMRLDSPAARQSSTTYQYDPHDPVPTVGSNQSGIPEEIVPAGPFDQSCDPERHVVCRDHLPLETRHDILVFKTPVLTEDVEVTGALTARLWVSSNALDTDFTIKLIDEYPPNIDYPYGYQMYISKGIMRSRYRNGRAREELMKPGEVYPVTLRLYPTANRFMKGHRVVVHISSSDFPEFERNTNSGERVGQARLTSVARNTLHHDARHPSHITLPTVETR